MKPFSADNGTRQIPSGDCGQIGMQYLYGSHQNKHLKSKIMITQNPIIGHAKRRIGQIYARTMYGKNILQSCPPPTKGKQTATQIAVCTAFGKLSELSNQISASMLNQIYYSNPIGRSRRAQWRKDLAKGMEKVDEEWTFNPSQIQQLGNNTAVSNSALSLVLPSTQVVIPLSQFSALSGAITTEIPYIILICPAQNICINLNSYTTVTNDSVTLSNLSETLMNQQCWLFPLWKINIGTEQTPIYTYGSFRKE